MKVGQFAVFVDDKWTHKPPYGFGCEILNVGKKVKIRTRDYAGSYRLLLKGEVLRVFDDPVTADKCASQALKVHQEAQKNINKMIESRNRMVHSIIKDGVFWSEDNE